MAERNDAISADDEAAALEAAAKQHDKSRQRHLDRAEVHRTGGAPFRLLERNERDRAEREGAIAQELRDRAQRLRN